MRGVAVITRSGAARHCATLRRPCQSLRRLAIGGLAVVMVNAVASAVDVEIMTNDGARWRGELIDVAPDLIIDTPETQVVLDWSEVFELRPLGGGRGETSASVEPLQIALTDGSRFGAKIESARAGNMQLRFRTGQTATIRTTLVQEITARAASVDATRALAAARGDGERVEDVVVVEREGRMIELRGAVRAIDTDGLRFSWRQQERELPWAVVAGVILAPRSGRTRETTVVLNSGERFTGRVAGGGGDALLLHTALIDPMSIAWERIQRIENRSDRVFFLSDIAPTTYEFDPMFDKRWDYAVDCTLLGKPLRLAGFPYDKGLTMHSQSRLRFNIDQQFRRFAAVVGISDEMDERGDAAVAVVGDGRVLWEAHSVRGNQPPQEVLVDITGVKQLTLVVEFGEDLDLSDHVVWALPRVIR